MVLDNKILFSGMSHEAINLLLEKCENLKPYIPIEESLRYWHRAAREAIAVNIQSVYNDHYSNPTDKLLVPDIPVTPPFGLMWMEYKVPQRNDRQIAIVCERTESNISLRVAAVSSYGDVMLDVNNGVFELDRTGVLINRTYQTSYKGTSFRFFIEVGLQALARMNCKNVEIRQIAGQARVRRRLEVIKKSYWNEIVITSIPKIRDMKQPNPVDDEPIIHRSHWVRGHYADYSKGKGLFGNPKLRGVFWIPEHKAGQKDLGQVVSTYRVE